MITCNPWLPINTVSHFFLLLWSRLCIVWLVLAKHALPTSESLELTLAAKITTSKHIDFLARQRYFWEGLQAWRVSHLWKDVKSTTASSSHRHLLPGPESQQTHRSYPPHLCLHYWGYRVVDIMLTWGIQVDPQDEPRVMFVWAPSDLLWPTFWSFFSSPYYF